MSGQKAEKSNYSHSGSRPEATLQEVNQATSDLEDLAGAAESPNDSSLIQEWPSQL